MNDNISGDLHPTQACDVDMVYCIDLTADMVPILENIKDMVCSMHWDLNRCMQQHFATAIRHLRVRVIGFRDFYADGRFALEDSHFFNLPEETKKFEDFVIGLEAKGGGDVPENALEALALAMQSDWCCPSEPHVQTRHIITLFTNAPAHPLEKAADFKGSYYPENMPQSYETLIHWWWNSQGSLGCEPSGSMDQAAKRLVLFVPEEGYPWSRVDDDFDSAITSYIKPGIGQDFALSEESLKMLGENISEDQSDEFCFDIPDFDIPDDVFPLGQRICDADIVLCLDVTAGMSPALQTLQGFAQSFHQNVVEMMDDRAITIRHLRMKVIGFRDFYCDGPYAIEESGFFNLPEETDSFAGFLNQLKARGGGDIPENSLEALALAMKSDWCSPSKSYVRKRHIIVLISDSSAHALEDAKLHDCRFYPNEMPESYSEFVGWWCGSCGLDGKTAAMDQRAKRLVLFVPEECQPWTDIEDDFDSTLVQSIGPGEGGHEISERLFMQVLSDALH